MTRAEELSEVDNDDVPADILQKTQKAWADYIVALSKRSDTSITFHRALVEAYKIQRHKKFSGAVTLTAAKVAPLLAKRIKSVRSSAKTTGAAPVAEPSLFHPDIGVRSCLSSTSAFREAYKGFDSLDLTGSEAFTSSTKKTAKSLYLRCYFMQPVGKTNLDADGRNLIITAISDDGKTKRTVLDFESYKTDEEVFINKKISPRQTLIGEHGIILVEAQFVDGTSVIDESLGVLSY